MRRIYHSKEDERFINRWRAIVVAAYAAIALTVVLISAHVPAAHGAGLQALSGPAPGFQKGGQHTRTQVYTAVAARPGLAVVAHR